jgi:tetratricopeptide (TPR) repeat protein
MVTALFLVLSTPSLAWESAGGASLARSLAATAQGQIEEAAVAAEQAREQDPAVLLYACHAGYLYGRLAAEGQSEMLPVALERYRECLAPPAARGWVDHLNLATLLWTSGQEADAGAAVAATTAQTPLEWMPWLNRGYWAEVQGDQAKAVHSYGWVLARDAELAGSPFWGQGDQRAARWNEIVAAGSEAVSQLGAEPAYWRWQVALAAEQTDAEATTREIEAWLRLHPADTEAMAWLGEALTEQGRLEEALSWLDKAVAGAPSRARSHLARGDVALALGRYAEAEQDLRIALFLEPSPRIHLGLARLAMAREDVPLALKEYGQALRAESMVHSYDLVLYRWMGWPVPLPQVLRIGYRIDGQAAMEWGALLEQQGDPNMAQLVYQAALDLDPFLDEVQRQMQVAPKDRE